MPICNDTQDAAEVGALLWCIRPHRRKVSENLQYRIQQTFLWCGVRWTSPRWQAYFNGLILQTPSQSSRIRQAWGMLSLLLDFSGSPTCQHAMDQGRNTQCEDFSTLSSIVSKRRLTSPARSSGIRLGNAGLGLMQSWCPTLNLSHARGSIYVQTCKLSSTTVYSTGKKVLGHHSFLKSHLLPRVTGIQGHVLNKRTNDI